MEHTKKEYVNSLSHEDLKAVTLELIGIHPDVGSGCVPACSGDGPTLNGYWVCSGGKCLWVPAT